MKVILFVVRLKDDNTVYDWCYSDDFEATVMDLDQDDMVAEFTYKSATLDEEKEAGH